MKHALYPTAGPKMRKWYGEGERLPRDGGFDPEGAFVRLFCTLDLRPQTSRPCTHNHH